MQATGVAAQSTGLMKPSQLHWSQRGRLSWQFILTSESVPHLCVLGVGRYQCFKSAWMFEVFHRGFSFPVNYKTLKTALQVYDKEVQWTLGAILYRTRFLPLRYGCELGARIKHRLLLLFAIIMASVVCECLGNLVSTDRGQNCRLNEFDFAPPSPPGLLPLPFPIPSYAAQGLIILKCQLPNPCTEGSVLGFLTFMALEPFSK